MADGKKISVAVCTWNGAELLPECLAALDRQSLDAGEFEVLVVDNNSTDSTAAVVRSWMETTRLAARYIVEPTPGLSAARNRAVEEARGEIIVFIDDDTRAHEDLLVAIKRAFCETGADLVGGKIIPVLPSEYPSNLPPGYLDRIRSGGFDLGDTRRRMLPAECVVGANMAVTRSLLARLGGFDRRLGYTGSRRIVGEDTDLCLRAHRAGALVVYEPTAVVDHVIAESRLDRRHVLRAAFDAGVGRATLCLSSGCSFVYRIFKSIALGGEIALCSLAFVLASWSSFCRLRCAVMISKCLGKLSVFSGLRSSE